MRLSFFRTFAMTIFLILGSGRLAGDPIIEIGSSPNPVGSGARALGMGNAFTALADDATAASWNPGGLTQLELPEASFAIEYYEHRTQLNSTRHPESRGAHSVSLTDLNYGSIVYPFQWQKNMAISLNYLVLYNFDKKLDFPFRESQQGLDIELDHTFEQDGTFAVVAPAFGVDLTENLSIGITLNIWNDALTDSSRYRKFEQSTGTMVAGGLEDEITEIVDETFRIDRGFSLVLGGLYQISPRINLGFVIKPKYALDIDLARSEFLHQSGELTLPRTMENSERIDADLHFPNIIGAGIAFRPMDSITFSTDVTWTEWSRYRIRENGESKSPISGKDFDQSNIRDTYTIRLGGEYVIAEEDYLISLRGGFGYDPAPAEGGVDDFFTASVGAGVQIWNVNLDFAYQYRWGDDVNKTALEAIQGTEDIVNHRALFSAVCYF